jgi:hypothetical protein
MNDIIGDSNKQGLILTNTETLLEHFINREIWLGKLAVQTATDWADELSLTPYQAISGNGDFGSDADDEAKVLGTDDTPIFAGQINFKLFRLTIVDTSETTPYLIRFVWGTGTMADAITANQYTSFTATFDNFASVPASLIFPKLPNGYKVWAQTKNATDNATINFFVGAFGFTV